MHTYCRYYYYYYCWYCRYTNLKIVKKLLCTDKIIVDCEGSDKMTPLHYAARFCLNDLFCHLILLTQIWKKRDRAQCAGQEQQPRVQ